MAGAASARAEASPVSKRRTPRAKLVRILSMQGLFPCGRRVRLPPSGGSRMRILRLSLLLALAFPAAAQAEDATIVMRNVPLAGERAPGAAQATRPLQPRRPPLARARLGAVPDALARRSLERLGGRSSRSGGPAGQRHRASARRAGSWRVGNPWWVGPSDRIEYRLRGRVTKLRAFFVWSPTPGVPGRTLQKAGAPAIVPRSGWNADEKIRRAPPSYRSRSAARARAPHGRRERLHGRSVAGDRPCDPALPREGKRLERHRLQLPRRPLRPGLRGALRRYRAERRRRPRRGVQHRLGRRLAAR